MAVSDSSRFALGQTQAIGLLILYCLIYVLPLYASPATRPSLTRPRDSPTSIRSRIRAVSLSTAACSLASLGLLHLLPAPTGRDDAPVTPWHLMGYWPLGLLEATRALALTALLFAGPLFEALLVDGGWRLWLRLEPLADIWSDWPTWRNLVAGPVTEECLFRSAAVPLLLSAGSSLTTTIFLSPLVFGLAHLHHFYEFRITNPQTSLGVAIARSVLQLSYTSLFGAYATFLFVRTGSLLAVILVHTFCNCMGLPRVFGRLEPYWLTDDQLTRTNPAVTVSTGLYYIILAAGAVGWWQNLYPLTQSTKALTGF